MQYNFCTRAFAIDHKFSMGLRSDEFPGQSNTFNFCFLKIVFTCSVEAHGARPCWNFSPSRYALHVSGMAFSKTKTSPDHLILGVLY